MGLYRRWNSAAYFVPFNALNLKNNIRNVIVQGAKLQTSDVLRKLHQKFSANFGETMQIEGVALDLVEINARMLAESGSILAAGEITSTQRILCAATEEVFADVVSSLYLGSIGLDRPAQMVLRRGFELGVAFIYLWDMPHLFWGWKECDSNLNFTDMIEHLSSSSYLMYIRRSSGLGEKDVLIDVGAAKRIYRCTSNIVHGQVTTHKVLSGDGYAHSPDEWNSCLKLVDEVETLLTALWLGRAASRLVSMPDSASLTPHIAPLATNPQPQVPHPLYFSRSSV